MDSTEDLINALAPGALRTPIRTPNLVASPAIKFLKERQPLDSLIRIRLGTVTGDSSYFLLTESRRRQLELPVAAVLPVLSKAKHLNSPKITLTRWTALKDADERVWLFNPNPRVINNRSVRSYLDFGLNGGCKIDNYKVFNRKPWFRCPELPVCDAFMSGMSSAMPTLSFRGMPDLTVTNTLYGVVFVERNVGRKLRLGTAISLLGTDARDQMRRNGRPYAAGLLKYDPCDLLRLQVPVIGSVKGDWMVYRRAVQALNNGDEMECSRIADSCIN